MSEIGKVNLRKTKPKFPWLVFLLLILSIYVFWILPRQMGDKPVQIEYTSAKDK